MNEQDLIDRATEVLAEHGAREAVIAAGIFNPRGHTGAMFAGGLAGDSVGGSLGILGSSVGTAGGALAGARLHDAASDSRSGSSSLSRPRRSWASTPLRQPPSVTMRAARR